MNNEQGNGFNYWNHSEGLWLGILYAIALFIYFIS